MIKMCIRDSPRAGYALEQIGRLYAVEEKIRIEHLEGGAVAVSYTHLRIAGSFPAFQQSQFTQYHRSCANGSNRFPFFREVKD